MKNMADNILKRMKEETVNKYFRVNNPEEWYFVLGMWMHYNLNKIKEQEVIRVVGGRPKQEALIRRATDVFQKKYVGTNKETNFWDGVFLAITAYRFDAEEENFDGRVAFNYGRMIEM